MIDACDAKVPCGSGAEKFSTKALWVDPWKPPARPFRQNKRTLRARRSGATTKPERTDSDKGRGNQEAA